MSSGRFPRVTGPERPAPVWTMAVTGRALSSGGFFASFLPAGTTAPVGVHPADGRTPAQDSHIASHEAGHCLIGRVFDAPIGGATIEPGNGFAGLVWGPSGDRSKLSTGGEQLFREARPLLPSLGEPRGDAAPLIAHAHTRCVELLAGQVAELVLHPEDPPLNSSNDRHQAEAFAGIVCCSPAAIDSFLDYAATEATALLTAHRPVLEAIATALILHRTLDGQEIDAVIAAALAIEDARTEQQRRAEWRQTVENAKQWRHGDGY
jgi:hypothetical protein